MKKTKKNAFSVLELSFIIVIIAIIGITTITAQTIVSNTKMTSIIVESEIYKRAIVNFYNQYQCIPGDCTQDLLMDRFSEFSAVLDQCNPSNDASLSMFSNLKINVPAKRTCAFWELSMTGFLPVKLNFANPDRISISQSITGLTMPQVNKNKDLSFEKIDSGFMIDITDKYFFLKRYIFAAVKNIKPRYHELDLSEFNEYTKDIEGWKDNIDNNHQIISGLIDGALIKAGVDRKKINNCILSEEHFVVHDREFPIDALNHGSISVYNDNYNATINSKQQPYTAFSIYKTGYDNKGDDKSIKNWLENQNSQKRIQQHQKEVMNQCNPESDTTYKPNHNPKIKFAKAAEFVYVNNTDFFTIRP
jgi:hypothetical protein